MKYFIFVAALFVYQSTLGGTYPDWFGVYEGIAVERHNETSGIAYQYLKITEKESKFIYSEDVSREGKISCDIDTKNIVEVRGLLNIPLKKCSIDAEYSLVMILAALSEKPGPFPLRSDAIVSLIVHINDAHIVQSTLRMVRTDKKVLSEMLQDLNSK